MVCLPMAAADGICWPLRALTCATLLLSTLLKFLCSPDAEEIHINHQSLKSILQLHLLRSQTCCQSWIGFVLKSPWRFFFIPLLAESAGVGALRLCRGWRCWDAGDAECISLSLHCRASVCHSPWGPQHPTVCISPERTHHYFSSAHREKTT